MSKNLIHLLIVGLLFLALFAVGYNACANLHVHKDDSGCIVVHCHPFDRSSEQNSPFQQHRHSKLEFLLYLVLSIIEFILVVFFFEFYFKNSSRLKLQLSQNLKPNLLLCTDSIRAPPVSP